MKFKKYLPLVGILIFAYLLFRLNVWSILGEIKNTNLFFLSIAMTMVLVSFFTSTLKWFVIARQQKIKVPFEYALKINLMSGFYGFVTPSRIGSMIRIEYLKKFANDRYGKGISNYILEKILDVSSLMILILVSSFFFRKALSMNYFNYALVGVGAIFIVAIVFMNEGRSKMILKIFYMKILPKKIKETAKDGFYSFYEDMPERKFFPIFIIFSLTNWVILYSIFYFIGLSVGINISFFYFLLFMPLTTFIGQIPITINGLGTREAAMISLFGLLGIPGTKIFSMSLINLVINGILPSIIGMLLILRDKKS